MKTVLALGLSLSFVFGLSACGRIGPPDTEAGEWTVVAPLPEPAVAYPSLVAAGGQVFVVGGRTLNTDDSPGQRIAAVNAYDPASGRWEKHTPVPPDVIDLNVVGLRDQIYVLGGKGATDVYRYDPSTRAWEKRGERSVPEGIGASASAVRGTKIYLAGGVVPSSTNPRGARVDDFARYDTDTGEWEELPPLPATSAFFGAGVIGDVLYTTGGSTEVGEVSRPGQTFAFDFTTKTWAEKAPMPTPVSSFAVATVSDRIYVFGGIAGETGRVNPEVQVYDPAADSWSVATPMTTPRFAAAATALSGVAYLAGGVTQISETEFDVVPYVEVFAP